MALKLGCQQETEGRGTNCQSCSTHSPAFTGDPSTRPPALREAGRQWDQRPLVAVGELEREGQGHAS